MTKTEFIHNPDGTVTKRQISEHSLGVPSSIFENLADTSPRYTKIDLHKGLPIVVALYKGMEVVSIEIDSLSLGAQYATEKDVMYPCFHKTDGSVFRRHIWKRPDDMRLWFSYQGKDKKCFLTALQKDKQDKLFKLNLTSIYNDSSICMGEYKEGGATMLLPRAMKALEAFMTNEWSDHLIEYAQDQFKHMFRFDLSGKQLDCKDWTKYCKVCSVANLAHLYKS